MPPITSSTAQMPAHEQRLPPENVARAAAAARAAAQEAPPSYENVGPSRRRVVGPDDLTVYAILIAVGASEGLPTEAEVRRAYAMAAAHNTTPLNMQNLILDLATAVNAPKRPHYMFSADRRLALGALMGIRVGFAPQHAQAVVDKARDKPALEIAKFLAEELAVSAGVALNGYGAYLVGGKAVAGMSAKGVAIKAGGLGVVGTAKVGAGFMGYLGLGVLAGFWAIGSVIKGGSVAGSVATRYEDVIEPQWFQDRRILAGLMDGIVVTDHPARAARNQVTR